MAVVGVGRGAEVFLLYSTRMPISNGSSKDSRVLGAVALLGVRRKWGGMRGPLHGVGVGLAQGCPHKNHLRPPCYIQALRLC